MNSVPITLYVSVGAITAALIAGAFSFFNLVASKENKISEFRQSWVDALRNDISVYVARMQLLYPIAQHQINVERGDYEGQENPEAADSVKQKVFELYAEAKVAYCAIHLRINKSETDPVAKKINDDFISALEEANECYAASEYDDLGYRLEQVVKNASALLKMEWNRVRDGEPNYKSSKRAAILIAVGALVAAACVTYALLSNSTSLNAKDATSETVSAGSS